LPWKRCRGAARKGGAVAAGEHDTGGDRHTGGRATPTDDLPEGTREAVAGPAPTAEGAKARAPSGRPGPGHHRARSQCVRQPMHTTSRQSCDGEVAVGAGLAGGVPESEPPELPDPSVPLDPSDRPVPSEDAGADGCRGAVSAAPSEEDEDDEDEDDEDEDEDDEGEFRDPGADADVVSGVGRASGREPCGVTEVGAAAFRRSDRPFSGDCVEGVEGVVEDRSASGRVDDGPVYRVASSFAEPEPTASGAEAASARSAESRSMAVKVRPPPTSATAVATTARRWFFFQRAR